MAKRGLVLVIVALLALTCSSQDSSSIENEVFGDFTSQNPLSAGNSSWGKDDRPDNREDSAGVLEKAGQQAEILSKVSTNGEVGPAMWTKFSWLAELFDHHKFDKENYRDVSGNCSVQMTTYLTALKEGEEWAAKVFDASGRYNSQFFFGNDFWLGSYSLCSELTRELVEGSKLVIKRGLPPFPLRFSVAKVDIRLGDFTPQNRLVSIGLCLPATCSSTDVVSIMQSATDSAQADLHSKATSSNDTLDAGLGLKLVKVRRVPGEYRVMMDKHFQIICGVALSVLSIMVVASVYEVKLNRCNAKRAKRDSSNSDSEIQNNNNGSISTTSEHNIQEHGMDKRITSKHSTYKEKLGTDIFSQILLSFSIVSNTEKIMGTKESTEDSIGCIHGLRFLSLAWVVMVHTYLQVFVLAENKTMRSVTEKNAFYQTVGNASYSVDTFFFISGLLVTFLYFKSNDAKKKRLEEKNRIRTEDSDSNMAHYSNGNNGKIQIFGYTNQAMAESEQPIPSDDIHKSEKTKHGSSSNINEFILLIIYRFIRLTPAYIFVIGLSELTLKYANNYSVFEVAMRDHETCPQYWWRNVLYINNFYPNVDMCMLWSWYMANDTQFYVIGLVLLLVGKRHFKASAIMLIILLFISWLTSGYISLDNNYRAKIEEPFEMFDQLYDKPWSRLGPYLIGMATGWWLWKYKGKVFIPTWLVVVGWPCALAIMASLIYGMKDGKLELWPTAFYVSIGHTAWGMAVAWVVVNCVFKPNSLLSKALSYRGLLPLSRLAYCAYLVHPVVMVFAAFHLDGPIHLHNVIIIIIYAGFTAISYLLAFTISLAFEAPVVRLLKISISRSKSN